jgi:branched-subunit amino acid aminotransferase/4-amino-4-deoxychorismate lyase
MVAAFAQRKNRLTTYYIFKNNIITELPRSNMFIVTAENKLATPVITF